MLLVAAGGAAGVGAPSFAAEFDANKPVKLRGTVTKMEWINPHAWIHIDVKKADGNVDEWMIECGQSQHAAAARFYEGFAEGRHGNPRDGYQSKDGSLRANGRDVTLPDGRKVFLGTTPTGSPEEK